MPMKRHKHQADDLGYPLMLAIIARARRDVGRVEAEREQASQDEHKRRQAAKAAQRAERAATSP